MLNFEAALEYAKTYGQRAGSLWSNDVTIVVRKAPELSVPVVAAQLSVATLYVVASDDEVAGASPAVAQQCFDTITGLNPWKKDNGIMGALTTFVAPDCHYHRCRCDLPVRHRPSSFADAV